MTNYFEAGKASAIEFFASIQAETAERRNAKEEIELVLGRSASEFRTMATLAGLRSLTLQGK